MFLQFCTIHRKPTSHPEGSRRVCFPVCIRQMRRKMALQHIDLDPSIRYGREPDAKNAAALPAKCSWMSGRKRPKVYDTSQIELRWCGVER